MKDIEKLRLRVRNKAILAVAMSRFGEEEKSKKIRCHAMRLSLKLSKLEQKYLNGDSGCDL